MQPETPAETPQAPEQPETPAPEAAPEQPKKLVLRLRPGVYALPHTPDNFEEFLATEAQLLELSKEDTPMVARGPEGVSPDHPSQRKMRS